MQVPSWQTWPARQAGKHSAGGGTGGSSLGAIALGGAVGSAASGTGAGAGAVTGAVGGALVEAPGAGSGATGLGACASAALPQSTHSIESTIEVSQARGCDMSSPG
jgi:hypothetical protein